jgi:hypothetical protein
VLETADYSAVCGVSRAAGSGTFGDSRRQGDIFLSAVRVAIMARLLGGLQRSDVENTMQSCEEQMEGNEDSRC